MHVERECNKTRKIKWGRENEIQWNFVWLQVLKWYWKSFKKIGSNKRGPNWKHFEISAIGFNQ